jgi:hypothetical protein
MKIYKIINLSPAPEARTLPLRQDHAPPVAEHLPPVAERTPPVAGGVDKDLLNYKLLVDVFKGYLDTALTIHTSYYAFTGAIAAYYLSHRQQYPYIKYSLLIPFFLGIALVIVSFTGRTQALTLKDKVDEVVQNLKTMMGAPPVDILRRSLLILGVLDLLICLSLLLLFFWWPSFIFDG